MVTFMAASVGDQLAINDSWKDDPGPSAGGVEIGRGAPISTAAAMSASRNYSPLKSMIGLPNSVRCSA